MTNFKEFYDCVWRSIPKWLWSNYPTAEYLKDVYGDVPDDDQRLRLTKNERAVISAVMVNSPDSPWESGAKKIAECTGMSRATVDRTALVLTDEGKELLKKDYEDRAGLVPFYALNMDMVRLWGMAYELQMKDGGGSPHYEETPKKGGQVDNKEAVRSPHHDETPSSPCGDPLLTMRSPPPHHEETSPMKKEIKEKESSSKGNAAAFLGGEDEDRDTVELLMDEGFDRETAVEIAYMTISGRDQEEHNRVIRFQMTNRRCEDEIRKAKKKKLTTLGWLKDAIVKDYDDRRPLLRPGENSFIDDLTMKEVGCVDALLKKGISRKLGCHLVDQYGVEHVYEKIEANEDQSYLMTEIKEG